MKERGPKPPRGEDARKYARQHNSPEPRGGYAAGDCPREQAEGAIGVPEKPTSDRPAFCLVGIEQWVDCRPADDEGELPSEIPGILNPCVHSLCADRTVNMSRVAGEEDATRAIVSGLAMMEPEVAEPRRIAEDEASTRRSVDDLLQLVEREVARERRLG
jgi:hypothetical protein